MKAPSRKLKKLASQEIPDMEKVLVLWVDIFQSLEITSGCLLRPDVYGLIGDKFPNFPNWGEFEETDEKEPLFLLSICKRLDDFLRFKKQGNGYETYVRDLHIDFFPDNLARLKRPNEFLGKSCNLEGTWEDVTRKLFEMEKLMLEQIQQAPEDLSLRRFKRHH